MSKLQTLFMIPLFLLLLNLNSFAQDQGDPQDSMRKDIPTFSETGNRVAIQGAVSTIIGQIVENKRGEKVGIVDDLVFQDAKLVSVLISNGGFLGVDRKQIQIPWEQVEGGLKEHKTVLVVDIDPESLTRSHGYAAGKIQNLSEPAMK
jgi:sporulation protein YlmC with PRC-barrel domain